jgi:hypothetical protein
MVTCFASLILKLPVLLLLLLLLVLHAGKAGSVSAGGKAFEVTSEMVAIKRVQKKLAGRNFVPSVIEPSFGIGRILYCIFEHSYYTREVRKPCRQGIFGGQVVTRGNFQRKAVLSTQLPSWLSLFWVLLDTSSSGMFGVSVLRPVTVQAQTIFRPRPMLT